MDFLKVKTGEFRSLSLGELKSAESNLRKEMAELRMDIYSPAAVNTGKTKKMKRALARLLTVRSEKLKTAKAEA